MRSPLDNLAGDWKLTREIRGQSGESTVKAEWVLNHQFLLVHMKAVKAQAGYEAMVFIGYDNTSERNVAHWIDVGGGRYSESLGYGRRDGNSIKFVFEYPDGPFLNTFTWNAETRTWTSLMQSKNAAGKWVPFAEDKLRRANQHVRQAEQQVRRVERTDFPERLCSSPRGNAGVWIGEFSSWLC